MNIDEEDLSREIFPLSHYATNRKRLINEAFDIIRGHQLESTIPPSLRGIDYTELKSLCLEELEKIDTLRIVDVIEGRLTSTPLKKSQLRDKSHAKKRKGGQEDVEVSIPVSLLKKKVKKAMKNENSGKVTKDKHEKESKSEKDLVVKKKKDKKKKKSKKADTEVKSVKVKSKSKNSKKIKKAKKLKKKEEKAQAEVPAAKPLTGEKTLMELLELEYRAKAIKALLKFQGFKDTNLDEVFDGGSSNEAPNLPQNGESIVDSPSQSTPVKGRDNLESKKRKTSKKNSIPKFSPITSSPPVATTMKPSSKLSTTPKTVQKEDSSSDEEDIFTNSIKPPVPSESKFELSIDVDDDLDFENPENVPDEIVSPENSIRNSDSSDSESEKDDDSPQNTLPPSPEVADFSEEDGEILGDSETPSRGTKFVPVTNKTNSSPARYNSKEGSDISSEEESVLPDDSVAEDSSLKCSVNNVLEIVSESEEGELSNTEDTYSKPDPEEVSNKTPLSPLPPTDEDADQNETIINSTVEETYVANSPTAKVDVSPSRNTDQVEESSASKPNPEEEKIPNVNEDLDYEEADEDESININVPTRSVYPEEATPITWYERWYSTKKVQKLVSSTKVCGKVRNKLRSDKVNQKKESVEISNKEKVLVSTVDEPDVPIIGSIEEYEKLFGKKIVSQNLDTAPPTIQDNDCKSPVPSLPEEDEDADEDNDLWGDIMGNS